MGVLPVSGRICHRFGHPGLGWARRGREQAAGPEGRTKSPRPYGGRRHPGDDESSPCQPARGPQQPFAAGPRRPAGEGLARRIPSPDGHRRRPEGRQRVQGNPRGYPARVRQLRPGGLGGYPARGRAWLRQGVRRVHEHRGSADRDQGAAREDVCRSFHHRRTLLRGAIPSQGLRRARVGGNGANAMKITTDTIDAMRWLIRCTEQLTVFCTL
mmetsp:Transcript_23193/g.45251  ORF Transcript_23193/g.45251 Transcript_23193/m.45251 type:complete len:213 (+) Transcript_23193:993-1631(+)